jgi:hypothetical protein
VDLSPAVVNLASEGSLDTSRDANGNSLQRQYFGVFVENNNDRKMVGIVRDGATFNDVVAGISDYPNIN